MGVFSARVGANRPICTDHCLLVLEVAGFPPPRPGQFVNVRCGGEDSCAQGHAERPWPAGDLPSLSQPELLTRQPLLRRPFSLAGWRRGEGGHAELEIIFRVVGAGTAFLAGLRPGMTLNVLGPLGNGFSIRPDLPAAAVIGGGMGIPPMLFLAEALRDAGKAVTAFVGARSAGLLPLTISRTCPPSRSGQPTHCAAEFTARGAVTVVATDDGSLGFAGLVHQAFQRWLEGPSGPRRPAVYACGPAAMLKAIADISLARGLPCQLAMERHMGCGLGTCQGCVIPVRSPDPPGRSFKLACKDGPVFDASEILW